VKNKKGIIVAVAAALSLSACADLGIPTPGNGKGRQGWYITERDSVGDRYECFWWSVQDSTAMWCKAEPVEGRK